MTFRDDVWSCDTCLLCQTKHATTEEKVNHENEKLHKDKTVVYDFLSKELSCLVPSSSESILYERYYRSNTSVAGLDCICELNFPWSKTPFWACTICYVAGKTLDSADIHLYSSYHKRNYISEYHPDRFADMIRVQSLSAQDKHSMIEQDAILDVLYDSKGLAPPDVYILTEKDRCWAFQKLGLSEEDSPLEYIVEPVDDVHALVQCQICGESFMAFEKEDQLQKAWGAHLSTSIHQKSRFMLTLIQEAKAENEDGLPHFCRPSSVLATIPNEFNAMHGAYYGPSCGFQYLVHFRGSNDSFCRLCFCLVSNADATDHFASEFHVERCVLLNAQYLKTEERQSILLACAGDELKVQQHQVCDGGFPQLLKRFALPDKRAFEPSKMEEVWIGSFKAMWCEDCKQYINLTEQDTWQQHIFEEEHFGWAAKRVLCHVDSDNFVSKSAGKCLPSFRRASKGWDDRYSITLGLVPIQDHCYYGLQFVVRDDLSRQTTCQCCYLVCGYEEDDVMCLHVRSYEHITRSLHMINKKLLGTIWKYSDVDMNKKLVLDYLKHCKLDSSFERLTVFDPVMACTSNCFGTVPRTLLDLAKISPESRQTFFAIEHSPLEQINVPLNLALRSSNVEIKALESDHVIFFCQECSQSFSSSFSKVDESFGEHILSGSHWRRKQILNENPFDENKRVVNQTSSFEVSRYKQANDKKVTWKWNETRKSFEFVYAQLGLSDIFERRNFNCKRDLFCTLCAEPMKASKLELEYHIRSFYHIFYYVHKHRPHILINNNSSAIGELESMLLEKVEYGTKHKNIRRLFARALKGLEKEQGEIAIYDFSIGRFCESAEVKNVLEDDDPMSIVDNKPATASMSIYANKTNRRNLAEGQKFVLAALNKSAMTENDAGETTLDVAKHKLLTEVEFNGLTEMETGPSTSPNGNGETGTEEQNTNAPRPTSRNQSVVSSTRVSRSRSKSKTPKRETRSPSPAYKKFHAMPDTRRFDYRHRPAFHSFHATNRFPSVARIPHHQQTSRGHAMHPHSSNIARFGGAYAYAQQRFPQQQERVPYHQRKSISPERKPGEMADGSNQRNEKSKRSKSRSRSPVVYYSENYRGALQRGGYRGGYNHRGGYDHRNLKEGGYRKRSRSRSRSTSRSKRAKSSARTTSDHKRRQSRSRSKSKSRSKHRTSHRDRSRSRSRKKTRSPSNHSRSSEEGVSPSAMQQSLMNRLKNSQNKLAGKIQINLPFAKETSPQAPAYRFRNAPDPSKIKREVRDVDPVETAAEERRSRWDKAQNKPLVIPPPPAPFLIAPPASARILLTAKEPEQKGVDSFAERLLKEHGIDLKAVIAGEVPKQASASSLPSQQVPLQTAPAMDHNKAITDLLEAAASISKITTTQSTPITTTATDSTAPAVLPSVNLTQQVLPPGFAMPPPQSSMYGLPFPFGNPALMTFTQFGAPPFPFVQAFPGGPLTAAFQQPPPVMPVIDQAELVMRAKMDLFKKDLVGVQNVTELIEYLWKQGYDKIPAEDPPLLFNEVVKKRKGILGANTLYQIICYGHPELETYYCGMCNHWTTVSEMFMHLKAPMHRLNYMFRNFKMYHRKALDEPEESVRDVLLDKFAEQIWNLEGSGQCSHRMRCILNEEAIRRLWPEYIDCIDNSWKILDLEEDGHRQEVRPSSGMSSTSSSQPVISATLNVPTTSAAANIAGNSTVVFDEPMVISPSQTPERANTQGAHPSNFNRAAMTERELADLQEQMMQQYLAGQGRGKEAQFPDGKAAVVDGERGANGDRVDRQKSPTRRRSPTGNGGRRERSRSRNRRSRSRSPNRNSRRERRRRSKSRSPKPTSSSSSNKKEERRDNWDAKAAAFLDKIGDRQGAMKLYMSSLGAEQSNDPPSPAYEALPLAEQESQSIAPPGFYEGKIRGNNTSENARLASDMAAVNRRTANESAAKSAAISNVPVRSSKNAPDVDEKVKKTRKALGAMAELQSIYEQEGMVTPEMVFQICEGMGIPPEEAVVNPMLREMADTFSLDMDVAYEVYINSQSQLASSARAISQEQLSSAGLSAILQQLQPDSRNPQINLKSLGTTPQEMMEILRKINGGSLPSSSAAGAKSISFRGRSDYQQPEMTEEVNYVYPGYDDEQAGERDPGEIESSINRMTFAFTNKRPMRGAGAHHLPPGRGRGGRMVPMPPRHPHPHQYQQRMQRPPVYMQQHQGQEEDDDEEDEEDEDEQDQNPVSFFGRTAQVPPVHQRGPPFPAHHHPQHPGQYEYGGGVMEPDGVRYWQSKQQMAGEQQSMASRQEQASGKSVKAGLKPNANLEPLGAQRVFPAQRAGVDPRVGKDPRQAQQARANPYNEYGYDQGTEESTQQQYDFTSDTWATSSSSPKPRTAGQPPIPSPNEKKDPKDYMHMADEVGDDWQSMESHMNSLLNPKKK